MELGIVERTVHITCMLVCECVSIEMSECRRVLPADGGTGEGAFGYETGDHGRYEGGLYQSERVLPADGGKE